MRFEYVIPKDNVRPNTEFTPELVKENRAQRRAKIDRNGNKMIVTNNYTNLKMGKANSGLYSKA